MIDKSLKKKFSFTESFKKATEFLKIYKDIYLFFNYLFPLNGHIK